jgi:thioredoxin-related protein
LGVVALRSQLDEAAAVNTRRLIACASVAAALVLGSWAQAGPEWLTDYKKAQQQAKTDNKLLLLEFTGSDWCGWCIRLDQEVFSKPAFKEYASKNLVLMAADFPRAKPQSASTRKQNEELAAQYQIFGFPTIVVLNGQGQKIGELSYMPGGPDAFIAELEKLRKG